MRPCISRPLATAVMICLPLLPYSPWASASAKATGTVGDTECVGGLHIGSKSSICVAMPLTSAAYTGEVLKPWPHTVERGRAPYSATCAAAIWIGA